MTLSPFHPAVAEWFETAFGKPTRAQALAWPRIASGRSTLVFAPTGSGKTLAAFLSAIDRLMFRKPAASKGACCRVLYVSPLRALAVDVERNLRAPLEGIARVAAARGDAFRAPTVAIRTGDTPQSERASMRRSPPDILITTPESLFLVLNAASRTMLSGVEVVIVDEIHTLVATKRGAHLALSLERVAETAGRLPQRVGLSATQRPLEVVARYLAGGDVVGSAFRPRPVDVIDAGVKKLFDVRVEVAVEDLKRLDEVVERPALKPTFFRELAPTTMRSRGLKESDPAPEAVSRHSIWPAVHPRLLELIRAHRSTIVFVNSRRLAERLASALNELNGEPIVRAHHGSIAREERLEMEEALKAGRLPAIVATSSLELGIDMGAVDLVIQIETPPSVASAIQRIGRASHQVDAVSRGILFPKYRADLLATAAITEAMFRGAVEETRVPKNPLDVLAQQVVAMVSVRERKVGDVFRLVRQAAPFADLPRRSFEAVIDMLSGRYPSDEFAELRPRVNWDRRTGTLRPREGVGRLVAANAGTIPDRGLFGVFLCEGDDARNRRGGRRVGELDEEMVFESFVGDVIVLGASSWRVMEITRDRVLVAPAPGQPGRLPFWKADRPPRPMELGRAIGSLTRELLAQPREKAIARLVARHALDARAADNLVTYVHDQKDATDAVPDDRTIVLERSRDEMGDLRLCLLSPFGGRIHAPWALALQAKLRADGVGEAETVWSDDGIVIRLPERDQAPDAQALLPEPEEIEALVTAELGGSPLFASCFREAAGRALLLPRRRPGQRSPLWMQRKRAHDLLKVAARYGSFPMILEAYRECLQDVFDLPALVDLARKAKAREVRLRTVDVASASPFAAALLFGYVANYLYEGDAPLAERRAQALSIDESHLRELLGEGELRELLDREVVAEVSDGLRGRGIRTPDDLHDALMRVGDLTLEEAADRVDREAIADPAGFVRAAAKALAAQHRIVFGSIGGEERLVAAEDAGRARDAFGVAAPRGLPKAFLEKQSDAFESWIARYARARGPFTSADVAGRYGVAVDEIDAVLSGLADADRLVRGGFTPGARGVEWCDPNVLRRLKQRSLARLRRQVEPVDPAAYARFLAFWHGCTGGPDAASGTEALLDAIEPLQGAAFPASILEADVLPARVSGYRPSDLDLLCAAGEIVWTGCGTLGESDGRVSLFLAGDFADLVGPVVDAPSGEIHDRIRAHLGRHGASFFAEIHEAAGAAMQRETLEALWDLVWSGEARNDSVAALRAFVARRRAAARARRFRPSFRSRRETPAAGVGRFSLVDRNSKLTPAQRAVASAEQLIARYGIVTRDAVTAEGGAGGFSALYGVFKAMEESGRVRRGYFVSGLGGAQFAEGSAIERLREMRGDGPEAIVLAAADPANAYGTALPWPKDAAGRAQRVAGAHVVLVDGTLRAYLTRERRDVLVWLPKEEPTRTHVGRAVAAALARWCESGARVDLGLDGGGEALRDQALAPFLVGAGFQSFGPGFRYVPAPAPNRHVDP